MISAWLAREAQGLGLWSAIVRPVLIFPGVARPNTPKNDRLWTGRLGTLSSSATVSYPLSAANETRVRRILSVWVNIPVPQ